ncbi:YcnI family protein [Candidatus Viadribacter manganicus]|uniref:YncI copper-binding domain-containing protein n=1 Tax=Candidatus Viadribacter manganicus TaxID=1759059 RepID=A0A1B1AGQ1_9PROT|nr:YcnI family protein [Candidatus Viadribacter manganicus]ANP45742.1 hypothetical protein ATE48_07325 [Candidatus Viadribacter manganicus]
MTKTIIAAVSALALSFSSTASAHVVFADPQAAPNSYYAGFIRIGHGCGTSPTRAIRVEIPESINIARPQPKPGWRLSIEHQQLATPLQIEAGHTISERVSAITWRGALDADQFDQFGIMMRLPDETGPLYFRITQTCANGAQYWDEIPPPGATWNGLAHPAAMITLAAPMVMEQMHDHDH